MLSFREQLESLIRVGMTQDDRLTKDEKDYTDKALKCYFDRTLFGFARIREPDKYEDLISAQWYTRGLKCSNTIWLEELKRLEAAFEAEYGEKPEST